jgi:hypothetical protein
VAREARVSERECGPMTSASQINRVARRAATLDAVTSPCQSARPVRPQQLIWASPSMVPGNAHEQLAWANSTGGLSCPSAVATRRCPWLTT